MPQSNFEDFANQVKELTLEFVKLYRLLDKDEKACYGVTVSQCYTLLAFDGKERLTMNELSNELGLSSSTMTRNVDVLIRSGYLERVRDNVDRRLVFVRLTESGKELMANLCGCEQKFFTEVLRTIPESEWEKLTYSLKLLLAALKEKGAVCCKKLN